MMPTEMLHQPVDKRIVINVGGTKHETFLTTLKSIPDSRLSWIATCEETSPSSETTEYFFDRHPGAFASVINYYRTGDLHAPLDVCGPVFEQELTYWGIEERDMEACCWPSYSQHRIAEKNIENLVFAGHCEEASEQEEDSNNSGDLESSPLSDMGSRWLRIRNKAWNVLEDHYSSKYAQAFALLSMLMILVSVVTMCISTLPSLWENTYILYIEYMLCAWFTLEFALRMICCPRICTFVKKLENWIDAIALVPFYTKMIFYSHHFEILRIIRLIRIFKAFKAFSFTSGLQVIVQSLRASIRELILLFIILMIPVILFSTLLYEIEGEPESKFRSIPHSFWWAVITMTTVGYGDVYPETVVGKLVGCICAICGVLIVALPVTVIGSNFNSIYTHARARLTLPRKKKRIITGDVRRLTGQRSVSSDNNLPTRPPKELVQVFTDNEIKASKPKYYKRPRHTGVFVDNFQRKISISSKHGRDITDVDANINAEINSDMRSRTNAMKRKSECSVHSNNCQCEQVESEVNVHRGSNMSSLQTQESNKTQTTFLDDSQSSNSSFKEVFNDRINGICKSIRKNNKVSDGFDYGRNEHVLTARTESTNDLIGNENAIRETDGRIT